MKIMIFRIGSLGDTIVALPAFNAIRRCYAGDQIILLSSKNPADAVSVWNVLLGTGLVDQAIEYNLEIKGLRKIQELIRLRTQIRKMGIDALIYLPPSLRRNSQIHRDKRFFGLCGIKTLIGFDNFSEVAVREKNGEIRRLPRETEFLLKHLEQAGVSTQNAFDGLFSKFVTPETLSEVDSIFPKRGDGRFVAVCASGKWQAQKWPLERFEALGKRLIDDYGVEPVLFGSRGDSADAETLISLWRHGINLCGRLTLNGAAEALRRCILYIGNDTGPMHLAAFAGVPCLAIFSARNNPGLWEPFGEDHTVLRKRVPCAGCELKVCNVQDHPCLGLISVEEVLAAAGKYLEKKAPGR
ncbi:MAG: hypothetical protein COT00_04240 [Candidatus Omnitrophica bacterium CG07_land_8_20_14_0_80_50_8]|nr:MAG: hypothetical protein COT00_04240 [Candidatus Omnitrophica bacterium CG07_land_8_20_14_0_80_50_8]